MKTIYFPSEFFNVKDTLGCGQLFRFRLNVEYSDKVSEEAFSVYSADKACVAYNSGERAVIVCEEKDADYFYNYFDLDRDYSAIVGRAKKLKGVMETSATLGKGIRILNQDPSETLFSFIVSQNNNIPRIKGIIERLCKDCGELKKFGESEYYSFFKVDNLKKREQAFFTERGLGYRAPYIKSLADGYEEVFDCENLKTLPTAELKKRLLKIYGVGPKVADCVLLFGFHRSDSFPVDTWIEKVYRENLNGELKNRDKISEYLVGKFGEDAGYFQQYLFYYKRSLENA